MERFGQCLCGEVQVCTDFTRNRLDICHCKNCQQQTGGPFAAFIAIPLTEIEIRGRLRKFEDVNTTSGNVVERFFCGVCGSPGYVRVMGAPNTAYVFSGLFDLTDDLTPKVHGWTSQKHRWVEINEQETQFPVDPGLSPE